MAKDTPHTSRTHGRNSVPNPVEKRYGKSQESGISGKVLIILFVVVMVFVGLFIFNQFKNATPANAEVSAVDWDIPNNNLIQFTVDVTRKNTDVDSYCIVTILDYPMNEVGRRAFLIPAGTPTQQRITLDVPTIRRAYAGKPYGCSDTIPPYLTEVDYSVVSGQ